MNGEALIITGGLLTSQERSLWQAARKCWRQWSRSRHAWLDATIKLAIAEPLAATRLELRRLRGKTDPRWRQVGDYFARPPLTEIPDLTQVVLHNSMSAAGVRCQCADLGEVFAGAASKKLAEASCILLSSTYLHDLSELETVVRRVKRPGQRLVVGGALMGVLPEGWTGLPEIDVVAVGSGESLAPAVGQWIRGGYRKLTPPSGGRLQQREHSAFLFAPTLSSRSLDHLPAPDWTSAAEAAGKPLEMIYYESVRGCPYRCSFCNYPYLFGDHVFRYKSAEKMADDWQRYWETLGVRYITCLDSLFTMPSRRLQRFCELLIQREIPIQWICYARADDLAQEGIVELIKAAGACQVQIGIESGDPQLLLNMNKSCTVQANAQALEHCRRHGLTSVVSLIVGYPGETAQTLENTYRFLVRHPPDFYFLAAFSTRVTGVPLLRPESRARFGLQVIENLRCMAPYWKHQTMSCTEVGRHIRRLDQRLMREQIALNATLFYQGMLHFRPELRAALLEFQHRAVTGHAWLRRVFGWLNQWVDRRLAQDAAACFAAAEAEGAPASVAGSEEAFQPELELLTLEADS